MTNEFSLGDSDQSYPAQITTFYPGGMDELIMLSWFVDEDGNCHDDVQRRIDAFLDRMPRKEPPKLVEAIQISGGVCKVVLIPASSISYFPHPWKSSFSF